MRRVQKDGIQMGWEEKERIQCACGVERELSVWVRVREGGRRDG